LTSVSVLHAIPLSVLPVFTQPGGLLFVRLVTGWVLCPTRRTVTGMIPFADPDGQRSHDAYHWFLRGAAWCVEALDNINPTALAAGVYDRAS
jgi:hypothetical protein